MYVIGIDIGTTGTKALLTNALGEVLGFGYREYSLIATADNGMEQNADDWWDAVVESVREAIKDFGEIDRIEAISLSTQAGSQLSVDSDMKPISPVMTWLDNRADKEYEKLEKLLGSKAQYYKTGWLLKAWSNICHIEWLRNNRRDVFDNTAYFLTTIEYINYKLTGRAVADPSNSAIRQMMDLHTSKWDDDVLSVLGISSAQLAEILPIGESLGKLTAKAAEQLGLSGEVEVFNGAHDQYCGLIGCGVVSPNEMSLSTGTTWVVCGVTEKLVFTDSYIVPGIHPQKGLYGAMGSLVTAGSMLKWYKELVNEDYFKLDNGALNRRDSAKDLFCIPYFNGAGFPHNDNYATGSLIGIRLNHDKYDIALALMEGVAFETFISIKEFIKSGVKVETLKMAGGGSKSPVWPQILSAVTGCKIELPQTSEACALGAAMIALVGKGVYPDYSSASRVMVKSELIAGASPEDCEFYKAKFERYLKLIDGKN